MMNLSTELGRRVLTAAIGSVALVLLIVFGQWMGICLITAILSVAMIYEFCNMSLTLNDQVEKRYILLLLTWVVSIGNFFVPKSEFELLIASFLFLFIYFLLSAKKFQGQEFVFHFQELKYSLFGVVYLVFFPLYLTRIHHLVFGVHWTLLFFLIVWAGDTLAYFVGKKIGKRKLYPEISPKKTIEGAVGGLFSGVFVAVVYKLLFFGQLSWLGSIVIPIWVGAFAQVGDLCESFLKRAYGKKDSGEILPGHGGFLDRFDGVVFSLPVMYACARLFG